MKQQQAMPPAVRRPRHPAALQLALLALSAALIVLGVLSGGARDVWAKAVKICAECIGLG